MEVAYLNFIANYGASILTQVGLKDNLGNELAGGSPTYGRKPVTWTVAAGGVIHPEADLVFNVPAGSTVAEWFVTNSAGTVLGGGSLTAESYTNQGEYVLLAASSTISHTN